MNTRSNARTPNVAKAAAPKSCAKIVAEFTRAIFATVTATATAEAAAKADAAKAAYDSASKALADVSNKALPEIASYKAGTSAYPADILRAVDVAVDAVNTAFCDLKAAYVAASYPVETLENKHDTLLPLIQFVCKDITAPDAAPKKAAAKRGKRVRDDASANAKAEARAKAKAEADARAKAKAEARAKARAEADARAKAKAEARANAEAKAFRAPANRTTSTAVITLLQIARWLSTKYGERVVFVTFAHLRSWFDALNAAYDRDVIHEYIETNGLIRLCAEPVAVNGKNRKYTPYAFDAEKIDGRIEFLRKVLDSNLLDDALDVSNVDLVPVLPPLFEDEVTGVSDM